MTVGFALAIFCALGWMFIFIFRVEVVSAALRSYRPSERRFVTLTPIVVSLHVTAACFLLSLSAVPLERGLLAGAVFVGALGFWYWGRHQIGPIRVRRAPGEPPAQLRRDGAFGLVRHPLYFAMLIAAGAPMIAVPQPLLLLSFAAVVACVAVRAVQEEARLHDQLGAAYESYCREVKRLVPFVW